MRRSETEPPPAQRGFNLLELLTVLAVLGLVATLAVPSLMRASAEGRLKTAAWEVASAFRLARSFAVRHGAKVGVRFHTGTAGKVTWTLHRDGDGDGVRNADIESGTDPVVTARRLQRLGPGMRLGFPPGDAPRDPGGRGRIGRLEDPVRFNRSDIASFSPLGTATPGSVYLTDGSGGLAAVRVTGRTGRVQVLFYDPVAESWEAD